MTAGVTLEGVSKRFGPVEAVHELTLDVREGEFFSIKREQRWPPFTRSA